MSFSRFDFERRVLSQNGLDPYTRFLLTTLATHLGRGGDRCWPSISTLEVETGLSRPTIIAHLNAAVAAGWITREYARLPGMKYKGSVYRLHFPPTSKAALPVKPPSTSKAALPVERAPTSKDDEPTSKNDRSKLVKPLNPNREVTDQRTEKRDPDSIRLNGTDQFAIKRARPSADSPVSDWAAAAGLQREPGETDESFRRRASAAYGLAMAERAKAPN